MGEKNKSSLEIYRNINTESTMTLARQAALAGVKRFIFISTIKVLGESNNSDSFFRYDDPLNPQDFTVSLKLKPKRV